MAHGKAVGDRPVDGEPVAAGQLRKASLHWLRHTFAKVTLLRGHTLVDVATALGHVSVDTAMIYTEQGGLDQIRAWEQRRLGVLAEVQHINPFLGSTNI
jgi:integrase/recombinase XerC